MDTPGLAFCSRDLFVAVLWNKSIWLYKIAVELQYLGIKVQFAIFSHADFWVVPYESLHSVPLLYFPCWVLYDTFWITPFWSYLRKAFFIYGWDVQVTIENWLLIKLVDIQIALQVPSPKFEVFAGTISTGCS